LEFGGWNIDNFQILSAKEPGFEATFQDRMEVTLGMPDREMEMEDTFTLYNEYRNYGPERQIQEFVALEVVGLFWFWPSWSETVDYVETTMGEEESCINTILTFTWPEVEGTLDGVRFWSAVLDADLGTALDYDVVEWGW